MEFLVHYAMVSLYLIFKDFFGFFFMVFTL